MKRTIQVLGLLWLFVTGLSNVTTWASDSYFSPRLGVSLATLQGALEKVAGPVTFAPRPGSAQGTQEARLAENAGVVQAGGEPGNLTVIILWLPVDAQGRLAGAHARSYLNAVVRMFTAESESVVLWVDQVLSRAIAASTSTPHLEALLSAGRQFKATYMPSFSPPMLSLTVSAAEE